VSKHWNPRRKTATRPPSRIRRDPVRIENIRRVESNPRLEKEAEARARKREVWGGVAGVVAFASALAAVALGIAVATYSKYDPAAAAQDARFVQCYTGGPNCVVDGETVHVGGEKVKIAGLDAPRITDSACDQERSRGIEAAVRLAELLNGGKVTVGDTFRDTYGRDVRKVQVDGQDVGATMISEDVAREYDGEAHDWCD
jgi:endonuclease YncB( thermonuclease family)